MCSSIHLSSISSCSGEKASAPSTPKPPAWETAATTSRQWLNAKIGTSMPKASQSGVRMAASDSGRRRLLPRGALGRQGLGPGIVGLPARAALDPLHQIERAGDLVAGDLVAAVRGERLQRRRVARARLQHGGDALAPARVAHAHHDHVEHLRVRLERGLDLLGEDLLAARVDADRAPAQQGDGAVGLDRREVTGDRVAAARRSSTKVSAVFFGVLVVAERHVAGARELAHHAASPARAACRRRPARRCRGPAARAPRRPWPPRTSPAW